MKQFYSWEYLLIDVANQFGLDKLLFEERIQWTLEHLQELESLADKAETRPLYLKAVMALRKVQKGIPTGHLVGLDAVCSGIQVMSALTGCEEGAKATGLINTGVRPDAYTACTNTMNKILGGGLEVSRKDAKQALMTVMYGSKKTPKDIFGEDTPELEAFYQAVQQVAPGAWDLLQTLLDSWQSYALVHAWKLPDGFDARVKVMGKVSARVEVDELDHATFTYEFYENLGIPKGHRNSKSLAANTVHSVDAFILREIHRRCNYDPLTLHFAHEALCFERDQRANNNQTMGKRDNEIQDTQLMYYIEQYERSGMPSAVILPHLMEEDAVWYLSDEHIEKLIRITERMKSHKPFEVVTVHDEFRCSPVNMNHLRQHYIDVFAELAESEMLSDILSQIHGKQGTFPKLSNDLGERIRQSNYALC